VLVLENRGAELAALAFLAFITLGLSASSESIMLSNEEITRINIFSNPFDKSSIL
jgi:hypothetical protein